MPPSSNQGWLVAFGRSARLQKGFRILVFSLVDREFEGEATGNSRVGGLRSGLRVWGDAVGPSKIDYRMSVSVRFSIWRSSKRSSILLLELLIFALFDVCDILKDLAAWKILLWGVAVICLQF